MPITLDQVSASGKYRDKPIAPDGFFSRAWRSFFQLLDVSQQNAPQYFFELHQARMNIDPTKLGAGSFFFETDTKKFYIADGSQWRQLGTAP